MLLFVDCFITVPGGIAQVVDQLGAVGQRAGAIRAARVGTGAGAVASLDNVGVDVDFHFLDTVVICPAGRERDVLARGVTVVGTRAHAERARDIVLVIRHLIIIVVAIRQLDIGRVRPDFLDITSHYFGLQGERGYAWEA